MWCTTATLGVALVTSLVGCASTPPSEEGAVPGAASATATDAESCEAFGDVSTIVSNADAGLADGRMEAQERDGWHRLATRVLDRIPTSGGGPVHDAIEQLKAVAPPVRLGAVADVDFRSVAWADAESDLAKACAASQVDLTIEGFTGG